MHNTDNCLDPACQTCLDHERHESIVRLELLILDAEMTSPDGAWVDSTLTVDALDIRNALDLVRGA